VPIACSSLLPSSFVRLNSRISFKSVSAYHVTCPVLSKLSSLIICSVLFTLCDISSESSIIYCRALCIKVRSDRARKRPIKLMLKIGSIHTERVDARQLICINQMSDVSLHRLLDF